MDIKQCALRDMVFHRFISGRNQIGGTGSEYAFRHDLHFDKFGNYLDIKQRAHHEL